MAAGRVFVVDPFNEPGPGGLGRAVVVPRLRQGDLHLVIAVTVAHPLKTVGLGDRGLDQLGHFNINHPVDFLGVAGDHFVSHRFGADHRHRDGSAAPRDGAGVEHHVLAGQQVQGAGAYGLDAVGTQLGRLEHIDRAGAQRILHCTERGLVGLGAACGRIAVTGGQARAHVDLAAGAGPSVNQPPDVDVPGGIEPDPVLGRQRAAGVDFAATQVDPVIGSDDGRVGVAAGALDEEGLLGHHFDLRAAGSGVEPGVGVQIDVAAGDGNAVVGVDVGVDLCLRLCAAGDGDGVDPWRQHTGCAGLVELSDGAFQAHHATAAQADGAALRGVDDGAIQTYGRPTELLVGRIGVGADAVGAQAVDLGHDVGTGVEHQPTRSVHPLPIGIDEVGPRRGCAALRVHAIDQGAGAQ